MKENKKLSKSENKKRVNLNLKKKPLIFLGLLLIIAVVSITYATFFSTSSIANRFESMKYDVTLEEEFDGTWGNKKVYVKNNEDATPVVVRVSYIEMWTYDVEGASLTLANQINGTDVVTKGWTNTWKNDFIDGGDGWYYYKKVLKPGETIQLLETIQINENLIQDTLYGDDYHKYDYELTFSYEAIQATAKAVKNIWNKDITISGDNVTW